MNRHAAAHRDVAQAVASSTGALLQRRCTCSTRTAEADDLLPRSDMDRELRRKAVTESESQPVTNGVSDVLSQSGQTLDASTRNFFEPRFGRDLSKVRIHADASATQSARAVNALAYTVGQHVVFDSAHFAPQSRAGRLLLAHEITHTIQQASSSPNPGRQLRLGPADDAYEREADRTASEVVDSEPPHLARPPAVNLNSSAKVTTPGVVQCRISLVNGGPVLQFQRRGSAGGCGICLGGDSRVAGKIAHIEVQDAFIAANPDMVAERIVPTVEEGKKAPFNPEVDLSYERTEHGQHVIYIGEIKPLDDAGEQAGIGRQQLQDYARELSFSFDEVIRMRDPPPSGPLFFQNPMSPTGCPPQTIRVQMTEPGLYQYFCDPPFSQLVKDPLCDCRPRERERERERKRVPFPVPVPEPKTAPQTKPLPIPNPQGGPRPFPVPTPVPKPAPNPVPEPEGGGEVIPFPGRPRPTPTPEHSPEEIPAAARSGWVDSLIRIGVPAALITAVIAIVVVAVLDPEPVSKLAAALTALLGIGTIAATAMALLIMRKVRDDGGPSA